MKMKVNVVTDISGVIQRAPIPEDVRQKVRGKYNLADTLPSVRENAVIDCLVGSDYYHEFFTNDMDRKQIGAGLYLVSSHLGWILTGRLPGGDNSSSTMSMFTYSAGPLSSFLTSEHHDRMNISNEHSSLEDFWKLETLGIKDSDSTQSIDDEKAMLNFQKTVVFDSAESRYQVTWPWKDEDPNLPTNYELACGRLRSLVNRLKKKDVTQKYHDIIQDQREKGIIEKVPDEVTDNTQCVDIENLTHYIPHHEVITPNKTTTKMRIVFDASAKTKKENLSLNDCLYRGPVILEDLCGLLLRFRLHKTALVADIEKAFLQVGLHEKDRDVTRFLWLSDPTLPLVDKNLVTYRFTRIPFGVISSPFLLAATINHALDEIGTNTAQKIRENLYVDNVITGVTSPASASLFYKEAKTVFSSISMNLREWASNSNEFLTTIPIYDRAVSSQMKVLGMNWHTQRDTLSVNSVTCTGTVGEVTKRQTLKTISSVYDPTGYFSPVTLRGKLLLQEIWSKGLDWDDKLDSKQQLEWEEIQEDLQNLPSIEIPRYVGGEDCQLLCFCDASQKAYATVVYLKTSGPQHCETNLLFSKSRVAPKQQLSIPRLELMAVLIGTRILKFVSDQLRVPLLEKVLWTDSKCVLHWLNTKKQLSRFVQHRVTEIVSHADVKFRYVTTHENPADIATKTKCVRDLIGDALWWHGPDWLLLPREQWPSCEIPEIDGETIQTINTEIKGGKVMFEMCHMAGEASTGVDVCPKEILPPFEIDIERYSSLKKLLRITAWCYRFVHRTLKQSCETGELTASEISLAKQKWENHVQTLSFVEEISAIKSGEKNNLKEQLGLTLDNEGIIRCHDRLEKADIAQDSVYPNLLPRKHQFTTLVTRDVHDKLLHSGTSHTLAEIRKEYWIPKGRTTVRSVTLKCRVCRKFLTGPYRLPKLPDLPVSRVKRSQPFASTGVDYFGPMFIKHASGTSKVWIALFTCLTVRAVHLDIICDLTAEAFLASLRRFIARRGKSTEISDNAGYFKVTNSVICEEAWQTVTEDDSVQSYLSNTGIEWKFIPEFAPWMEGFYERLLAVVKNCLPRSIGKLCLIYDQLMTLLIETEAVVNSRPLEYVGEDFEGGQCVITPADFLCLNTDTGTPDLYSSDCDSDPDYRVKKLSTGQKLLQTWAKGQKHLDMLWKLWYDNYLLSLRERTQRYHRAPRVQANCIPGIGDVVLVKDKVPRGSWKLAVVTELLTSRDGEIRSANVRTGNRRILTRPINLLYPLEGRDSDVKVLCEFNV